MAALRASAVVGAASLALAGGATAVDATPAGPTRSDAWIARVVAPTIARAEPGAGAVVARLGTRAHWNGGPLALLVLRTSTSEDGRLWLEVRLPIRPNATAGWIPADVARLRRTPYRIEISTSRRVVRLLESGRSVASYRAVVGRASYPTPRGLFAVSERVAQPDPHGFLGPWALHLTAYSDTLIRFGGGPGTVALHGRGPASLGDPLGSARSHGCVRVDNAPIRLLARVAREGTPVVIS